MKASVRWAKASTAPVHHEPLAGAEQPALPGSSGLFLLQNESFWGSLGPGASPEPQDPEYLAPSLELCFCLAWPPDCWGNLVTCPPCC